MRPLSKAIELVMKRHKWFSLVSRELARQYGYPYMGVEESDLPRDMLKWTHFPTVIDIPVKLEELLDIMRPGWRETAGDKSKLDEQMEFIGNDKPADLWSGIDDHTRNAGLCVLPGSMRPEIMNTETARFFAH
jgi:hypothetical protein